MKTLNDKEAAAVKWLIHWTYEEVQRILDGAEEMSRLGETEKTYYPMVKGIVDTLTELEKKL